MICLLTNQHAKGLHCIGLLTNKPTCSLLFFIRNKDGQKHLQTLAKACYTAHWTLEVVSEWQKVSKGLQNTQQWKFAQKSTLKKFNFSQNITQKSKCYTKKYTKSKYTKRKVLKKASKQKKASLKSCSNSETIKKILTKFLTEDSLSEWHLTQRHSTQPHTTQHGDDKTPSRHNASMTQRQEVTTPLWHNTITSQYHKQGPKRHKP